MGPLCYPPPMPDAPTSPDLATLLRLLETRRSLKPRLLGPPGPAVEEIERLAAAALTAPDHGRLGACRFIVIEPSSFPRLADAFEAAAHELGASSEPAVLAEVRAKAADAPALVAVVAATRSDLPSIPTSEQLVAVGAALQSFLLALHAAGWGASILSGPRVATEALRRAFALGPHEQLVGFVPIGTPTGEPKPRKPIDLARQVTRW